MKLSPSFGILSARHYRIRISAYISVILLSSGLLGQGAIIERGANHRVVQKTSLVTNEFGQAKLQTSHYTEMAGGFIDR